MGETYRAKLERLVWKHTSPDYKCVSATGIKQVLVRLDGEITALAPLSSLTDAELYRKLPNAVQDRIVDADRAPSLKPR
jgi:hypothetical protein